MLCSLTVQLQRRSGDTWRTVNTGIVDEQDRYTAVATPPTRSTFTYRVHAPADGHVAGTSPMFTIRGT